MGIPIFYDKPFLTYDEQIHYLRSIHKLNIANPNFAKTALKSITYYDLINGYKDCFMENDEYIENMTLEFIYHFHFLDKSIQTILFKYSTIIENSYKGKLAYVLSTSFGEHQDNYLNPNNFYKTHNNNLRFSFIRDHCLKIISKPDAPQPTKHYVDNHNHIPAWILFKNVTFSNSINLLLLLKPREQTAIIDLMLPNARINYNEKVEFLIAALNIIRHYRNTIAHNLKFITFSSAKDSLKPNAALKFFNSRLLNTKDVRKKHIGTNDIYSFMLSLILLLGDNNLRRLMVLELLSFIDPPNPTLKKTAQAIFTPYFEITKLPDDLPDRLNNYEAFLNLDT